MTLLIIALVALALGVALLVLLVALVAAEDSYEGYAGLELIYDVIDGRTRGPPDPGEGRS